MRVTFTARLRETLPIVAAIVVATNACARARGAIFAVLSMATLLGIGASLGV